MADNSSIEWTDATWNPVTGCTKISPGCDRCYAATFAERWRGTPGHYFENGFDVTLRADKLDLPLRWKRPRRVFVNSMSDLFHENVPDEFIARVFAVMAKASQHTFQLLTKRHGRMRSLLGGLDGSPHRLIDATTDEDTALAIYEADWPLPNVHLGVSVENQHWADIRIPALLGTPAAVRWISAEPLLGPLDLHACWLHGKPGWGPEYPEPTSPTSPTGITVADLAAGPRLDWVVTGGESGHGARPMHPAWARSLRDQCVTAGVAFSFKQWGGWAPVEDADDWRARRETDWHVRQDGYRWPLTEPHGAEDGTDVLMRRVDKKTAGRLLDGRTWDEYPAVNA